MTISVTTTNGSSASTQSNALGNIASDYNEFLTLLTTQLQNQDPTQPMDTSQFTAELAQFAGVEQQVSTNSNLTSLIQLTQAQEILQGSSLLGKQVDLSSTSLPLQSGAAHVDFTAPATEAATIKVTDASGNLVSTQSVSANAGTNGWDWNGTSSSGTQSADGTYNVSVTGPDGGALAFTTRGTVTGLANSASGVLLQFGGTTLSMNSVAKVE